jgi:HEAT repeat protein
MKRLLLSAVVASLACGCGQRQAPLAGGKPVAYWLAAIKDPDGGLRKKAVLKLGNVGATDPAVVPALLEALKDRKPAVRRETIVALMKCGPEAQQADGALSAMKEQDPDPGVRTYAARALEKLRGSR